MFAVIRTGGKQYRVAPNDIIKIEKIAGNPGDIVELGRSPSARRRQPQDGQPADLRRSRGRRGGRAGPRREDHHLQEEAATTYRRKNGHRQEQTTLRITEILTDGKKPSKVAAKPEPKKVEKPAEPAKAKAEAKPAAKKAEAKKAEPKPAAKKAETQDAREEAGCQVRGKAPAKKPAAKPKK